MFFCQLIIKCLASLLASDMPLSQLAGEVVYHPMMCYGQLAGHQLGLHA